MAQFTSMPDIKLTGTINFGPKLSDIAGLKTKINGQDYYYLPQDYIQKGVTASGDFGRSPGTYFNPGFLSSTFQQELKDKGTYVDLSNVPNVAGDNTFGEYLTAVGRSTKGYLVPATQVTTNAVENWQKANLGPNGESGIVGVGNTPDGIAYLRTDTQGKDLNYTLPNGQSHQWSKPSQTTFQKFISDLGPLPTIATAIFAPQFLPLVTGAQTAIQGGDLGDVLKAAGTSYILQQGTSALAPEVDLNAATSGFQDVYGGALPIEDVAAAFEPVVPEAVTVGAAIPTPDIVPTPLPAIEPSVVQPDYFSADAGPLADTTVALDDAFVQDMSQGIEPVIPPENPFLAGMEETTATEGAGVAGAENPTGTYTGGANYLSGMEETAATEGAGVAGADNPTGTTVTVPESTQEATKNLTPKQIYQLLKLGGGLFGGAGALTMAAKGLTGGAGALGGLIGTSMPSVQAPTPFTGTYSGMNPYDAAYFQQVQQNYNRLFPTTPANVAGPLESWYQTKYVPDTTISNKLFGV
jgi:hypothetical protein